MFFIKFGKFLALPSLLSSFHQGCVCVCVCMFAQSCLTLCNPMDCSPPGSSLLGILQAGDTGAGCYYLLHGIFLTRGSNWHLLCVLKWQADPLSLCHLGSLLLSLCEKERLEGAGRRGRPFPPAVISEVIDISPDNLDSSLCFIQPSIVQDVLCI